MAVKSRERRASPRSLRAQVWWVLRKNGAMTLADILLTVHDGTHKNPETNIRGWLNGLVRVGILSRDRVNDGKLTSNGSYLYTVVNDLGAKPPVIRPTGAVYDANNDKIYQLKQACLIEEIAKELIYAEY